MEHLAVLNQAIKLILELTAATGHDLPDRKRREPEALFKELSGHLTVEPGHGYGQGIVTDLIDAGSGAAQQLHFLYRLS